MSLIAADDRATRRFLGAALWATCALFAFSLFAIAGREAGRRLTTMEVVFWRSLLALLIVTVLIRVTSGSFAVIRTQQIGRHALRNGIHFIAQYCWIASLGLMPLAQLFALEFTSPLWTTLLAPLLLRERLTGWRIAAAMVGFAGMLVVVRPGGSEGLVGIGVVLALISAVGYALSSIFVKQIVRSDSAMCLLFWMSLMQCGLSFLLCAARPVPPNQTALLWLVAMAFAGLAAHYSLARALTLADAIVVAPLDFLRLPLIAIVGAFAYAEPLDPVVLAGGAIVIAANAINLWGERTLKAASRGTS